MFIEQYNDEGLAHLSYLVGDSVSAFVIDPRIDIEVYLKDAKKHDVSITHIFETHRNEDYLIGSCKLAARTGAKIYHGVHLDFEYGEFVSESDEFKFGDLKITILETPGHTPESISLVLHDLSTGKEPLCIFTGDALFVGTAGRTDLWKTREEAASILYESIFQKILPLGEQVIIYPAHGAGSVCGSDMAKRNFSTIGYEKKYNSDLQCNSKEEFIKKQSKKEFEHPPYFQEMENRNKNGTNNLFELPEPRLLCGDDFVKIIKGGMQVIDVRSPESYSGASIPGALALPNSLIAAYAGWFLSYDKDIAIISDTEKERSLAVRLLARLGYTKVAYALSDGLHSWEITGQEFLNTPSIHVNALKNKIKDHNFILLDVRKNEEWKKEHIENAKHIFLGELPGRLSEIDKNKAICTFCGSGQRAIVASSILQLNKFSNVFVCLGSMSAWKNANFPVAKA